MTLLFFLLLRTTSMSISPRVLIRFHLSKGATNATVVAAGGNDTVVAALTFASSSIQAGDGDDSLSISVLSLSTLTAGSGADTINLAKGYFVRGLYKPGK